MDKTIGWVILVAVVLGGAVGLYFWLESEELPLQIVQQPPAPAPPPEPAILHPIEEIAPPDESATPAEPLPALIDSDPALRAALEKLFGDRLEKYFNLQDIARRFVATVDNLTLASAPLQVMPLKRAPGWLVTTGRGEKQSLSPRNAARYRPYIRLAEAAPTGALVAAYVRFYPLFQEQYERLGYPGKYFNDRVVQVIDHLLATPEVKGPVLLTQIHVLYQFADPTLEALSAGQKILVRIGPENAAKVKAKLLEIRSALVTKPPKQ